MTKPEAATSPAVGSQVDRGVRSHVELPERLRDWADETYVLQEGELPAVRSDMAAAADEIERLRAEVVLWQAEYAKADIDWQDATTEVEALLPKLVGALGPNARGNARP